MRSMTWLLVASVWAGCVTRPVGSGGGGVSQDRSAAELAPVLVVERFLRAANSVAQQSGSEGARLARAGEALDLMARLFGTRDGSIVTMYPRDEVEQRMALIAEVLRHDDYEVMGDRGVPGRSGEAVEVEVLMHVRDRQITVPFTVVQTQANEWLIERVDLERLLNPPSTAPRPSPSALRLRFDQLDQDATGTAWVQEGDLAAAGARTRFPVDDRNVVLL